VICFIDASMYQPWPLANVPRHYSKQIGQNVAGTAVNKMNLPGLPCPQLSWGRNHCLTTVVVDAVSNLIIMRPNLDYSLQISPFRAS